MEKCNFLFLFILFLISCIPPFEISVDPITVRVCEYNPEKAGAEIIEQYSMDEISNCCYFNNALFLYLNCSEKNFFTVSIYDLTLDNVKLKNKNVFYINNFFSDYNSFSVKCIIPRNEKIFFLVSIDGINQIFYSNEDLQFLTIFDKEIEDAVFKTMAIENADYISNNGELFVYYKKNRNEDKLYFRKYRFNDIIDNFEYIEEQKQQINYNRNNIFKWYTSSKTSNVIDGYRYFTRYLYLYDNDNPEIKKTICLSYLCITNSPIYVFATDDDYIWIHYVKRNDDTQEYEYKLLKLKLLE